MSSNSNFEHTERNQQEVIKVIDELIKEAIAVAAVANEHACTLWFILLDKNEKSTLRKLLIVMVIKFHLYKVLFPDGF